MEEIGSSNLPEPTHLSQRKSDEHSESAALSDVLT